MPLTGAVTLTRYYSGEPFRLFEHSAATYELQRAEKLLKWRHAVWGKQHFGLSHISERPEQHSHVYAGKAGYGYLWGLLHLPSTPPIAAALSV